MTSIESTETDEVLLRVEHKGQHFAGLIRIRDDKLHADRYTSSRRRCSTTSSVFLPLLHGMGPMTSCAGSMFAILNTLTASKRKKGRSKSLKLLRELPNYRICDAEAIDLPGCFGRQLPEEHSCLDGICNYVRRWLVPIQTATGAPIIPIARCASATIVVELNRLHPGLFEGMILLSPMLPSDAEHSNNDLIGRVAARECELNEVAYHLMNEINSESTWESQDDPFMGLPTLILTGSNDQQTSADARQVFSNWDHRHGHVTWAQFDTGHDVFDLKQGAPAVAAFGMVYQFLRTTIEGP